MNCAANGRSPPEIQSLIQRRSHGATEKSVALVATPQAKPHLNIGKQQHTNTALGKKTKWSTTTTMYPRVLNKVSTFTAPAGLPANSTDNHASSTATT